MEEWLAEFDERVKQMDARPRELPSRRRRPRGLARIVPVTARPERPRETSGAETGRAAAPEQQRRGRRRRRGGGGGGDRSGQGVPSQPTQGQARPQRGTARRQSSSSQPQPGAPRRQRDPNRRQPPPPRPSPTKGEGDVPGRPPTGDAGDPNRRRRRRGRGRGRGPRPNGPPPSGGPPPGGPPSS